MTLQGLETCPQKKQQHCTDGGDGYVQIYFKRNMSNIRKLLNKMYDGFLLGGLIMILKYLDFGMIGNGVG